MTDEEYTSLLRALAVKYLRLPRDSFADTRIPSATPQVRWQDHVQDVYALARLLNAAAADPIPDERLLKVLGMKLQEASPLQIATSAMEDVGILDGLEEAPFLVFREFRRSAFPDEDIEILRRVGLTNEEIEVLIPTIVFHTQHLGDLSLNRLNTTFGVPTRVLQDASTTLDEAAEELTKSSQLAVAPMKKRKLFNGIGKLLAGSVMGIGNALIATGTVLAPNPATGYIAIASGAGAIGSLMAGIGDLKGE